MPVIIGRVPSEVANYSLLINTITRSMIGCLQNFMINEKYQDFSKSLIQQHVVSGCQFTDVNCDNNPCNNSGVCIGEWAGFQCVCPTSHKGDNCNEGKCMVFDL